MVLKRYCMNAGMIVSTKRNVNFLLTTTAAVMHTHLYALITPPPPLPHDYSSAPSSRSEPPTKTLSEGVGSLHCVEMFPIVKSGDFWMC